MEYSPLQVAILYLKVEEAEKSAASTFAFKGERHSAHKSRGDATGPGKYYPAKC